MARPQHPPSRLTVLGAALATAGLVVSLPAAAQQSSATKAEADTTQTVVISANKRLETQREVAGTVSVLQGSDLERTVLGPERTVILADVMGHIGRPRLARVAELLASRGRRSVVVVGDAIGTGDEWAAIDRWLRSDGARRVSL